MNYKIKFENEAESKEVQELFFELGYTWSGDSKDIFDFDMPEYIVNWNNGYITVGDDFDKNRQEITLPQLRDLVVLKRETLNDKVATAETARQADRVLKEILEGSLPEFDFELNVEQGQKHSHYKKDVSHLNVIDIYRVTEMFSPHACGAHIAKKALCSGQREHKDLLTDIQDIIDTAERWKEMLIEDANSCKD